MDTGRIAMVSKEVHILYRYIVGTLKKCHFWYLFVTFFESVISPLGNSHLLKALTIGSCPSRGQPFQNLAWLHAPWNLMLGTGHNEREWGGKEARSSAWLGLHFPSKTKQNVCTLATWNASLAEGVRANDSLFKGTL